MNLRTLRAGILALSALLVVVGLSTGPATTQTAAAAAPVYYICNSNSSVGANPINDRNYFYRNDPFYPVVKFWSGDCKNVTVTSTTRLTFVNYNSWRVTSNISAKTGDSSWSSCHTGPSDPGGNRKYIGYPSDNCTAVPGA